MKKKREIKLYSNSTYIFLFWNLINLFKPLLARCYRCLFVFPFFCVFATLIGDLLTIKCPEESASSWNEVFPTSSFSLFSLNSLNFIIDFVYKTKKCTCLKDLNSRIGSVEVKQQPTKLSKPSWLNAEYCLDFRQSH